MFGGIVHGAFPVCDVARSEALLRYAVELDAPSLQGLTIGASVAIDGVCQTVVQIDGPRVHFEAIAETLARTTLGALKNGALVNVERSLRAGDEIGGHEMSGHIRTTGTVEHVRTRGDEYDLRITCPNELMKYVLSKGFVGVHGCSLTVGEVREGSFDVHLIPETLRRTNLGALRVGDRVNLELDTRTVAIVDTVERVLAERFAREQGDP